MPTDPGWYRRLVENLREGIALVTPEDGVVVYCNRAYAGVLGLAPEELIGRSIFEFFDGGQKELVPGQGESLFDGLVSDRELSVTADGTRKVLSCTGFSPFGAGEGPCAASAVHSIVDVTAHRGREERLRASEELFRMTFEAAGVGIAHVSTDGRWLRINDKLCEISGYTRDEFVCLGYLDLVPPEDRGTEEGSARRLLSGEIGHYSEERRLLRKDRSRVWVRLSASLVRGSSGEPDYVICVIEDITERKLGELLEPLTSREMEVLRQITAGHSNRRIAHRLLYSEGTVKLEVQHILAKLGVSNRRQAALRAVELGLVPPTLAGTA